MFKHTVNVALYNFRPSWIRQFLDKLNLYGFYYDGFEENVVSVTIMFMPNSIAILQDTSFLTEAWVFLNS
jgi:hypothetical protein